MYHGEPSEVDKRGFEWKTSQIFSLFAGEIEELKQDLSSFRFEMLNTLETQQKALTDAVSVINSKLDLMFSGVAGGAPGSGLPTAPPPPPPPPAPGGYGGPPSLQQQPSYSSAPPSGQYSSSDQYSGTELYVRPPDPDLDGSHGKPISRDRPGSDHSDTHVSLSFIPEEHEDGGGNASETDSVIHGQCSDPDDECGGHVSIEEEEIVPQKAVTSDQKPPSSTRKRSKKRRTSSSSSMDSVSSLRTGNGSGGAGSTGTTVAEVRSPASSGSYYSDSHHLTSSPASSSSGPSSSTAAAAAGGEQFKPRYISNTEELNKLVRLLEPHS